MIVKATTLASAVTLNRVARSILRIKGRIVKVSPEVQVNAEQTILELRGDPISGIEIPSVTSPACTDGIFRHYGTGAA